jgi:hypothetical protein
MLHPAFLYCRLRKHPMKQRINIFCLSVLIAVTGRAVAVESMPFQVGEKLTYQIFWGPFVAGRATMEVAGIEPVDGHDCYHLVAQARTTGLVDLMFHVESTTESWLDVNELCTRRYRQSRNEGKHAKNDETHFDYISQQGTFTNKVNGKSKTFALTGPVQDVVSTVYYVRSRPLEINLNQSFHMIANASNHVVNVCPDQRKTLAIHPLGDVTALRIEPKPTISMVAANNGRIWFWISDDKRHLPLLVSTTMKIGSAKLVLFKVETAPPVPDKIARTNPPEGSPFVGATR